MYIFIESLLLISPPPHQDNKYAHQNCGEFLGSRGHGLRRQPGGALLHKSENILTWGSSAQPGELIRVSGSQDRRQLFSCLTWHCIRELLTGSTSYVKHRKFFIHFWYEAPK